MKSFTVPADRSDRKPVPLLMDKGRVFGAIVGAGVSRFARLFASSRQLRRPKNGIDNLVALTK